MSLLDKVKKLNSSLPVKSKQKGSFATDIWHSFHDGDNNIRLVGEFIQTRGHFIAPNKGKGLRGLCRPDAFIGDNKLQMVINCGDWDIDTESYKPVKTCTICRLNNVANNFLKNKAALSKEENEFYFNLRSETNPRNQLKWNIIDRDNPFITIDDNGNKKKVKGLKIASFGMEAWKDISRLFEKSKFDITSADQGIDLIVTKTDSGRVSYKVDFAMNDDLGVKKTPLTDEERAFVPHDLKKICGKQVDQEKVLAGLHADYQSYLEEVESELGKGNVKVADSTPMAQLKEKLGAVPAPKTIVTVPSKVSSSASGKLQPVAVPDSAEDVQLDGESDWGDFPSGN